MGRGNLRFYELFLEPDLKLLLTLSRHIERCVCLLYIIDTSLPEPWQQLEVLRYEIGQYNSELLGRHSAVVANKMDLPKSSENLVELRRCAQKMNLPLFAISAQDNKGVVPVLQHIRLLYDTVSVKNAEYDEE